MKRRIGLATIGWLLLPIAILWGVGAVSRHLDLSRDLDRAYAALEAGNDAAASDYFGAVLARQPERTDLLEPAGRAALNAGQAELAIARLLAAETAGDITDAGYLALGDAFRGQAREDEAVHYWSMALETSASPVPIHYRLLEVHRRRGDFDSAIADLRALAELEPQNAETHYQLGLLLAAREPQSALAALLQASALDAEFERTVRLLEQGLAAAPEIEDPAVLFFNAGRALASLGEWNLSAEAFRQAVMANGAFADAWAFLGEAMFQLDMDGSEMLTTALEIDADSLTANLLYAIHLRRSGNPALALRYLEHAAEIAPGTPAVAAEIGQTYAEMGQVNDALDSFVTAAELAQNDDVSYLHLLAMYSIYNELQVEDVGLPAARAAVLKNPEDPVALDLIGYAYYQQGDWVSGLRFLHRSLNANPNYAPARLHLGMLLLIQDDAEAARAQFQWVLQSAPESDAAAQARSFLQIYFP